jgi:hypothetical protein
MLICTHLCASFHQVTAYLEMPFLCGKMEWSVLVSSSCIYYCASSDQKSAQLDMSIPCGQV